MPWVNVFAESDCGVSHSNPNLLEAAQPILDVDAGQAIFEVCGTEIVVYLPASVFDADTSGGVLYRQALSMGKGVLTIRPAAPIDGRLYRVRYQFSGYSGESEFTFGLQYLDGSDVLQLDQAQVIGANAADFTDWHEFTAPAAGARDWIGLGMQASDPSAGQSFTFHWQVFVEEPQPPAVVGEPYVIRGTHRVYAGSNNPQSVWVRTETGKLDLSAVQSLEVQIKRDGHRLFTVPATSPEVGRVNWTITADQVAHQLRRGGSFWLYVLADGQIIYTGLLEVIS